MSPATLRKIAWLGTTILGLSLAAVFALHHPTARAALDFSPECPFGGSAPPAQIDALRAASLSPLRGTIAAPARLIFGFEMDHTRRDQVESWAAAERWSCTPEASQTALRCEPRTPGPIRSLYARFDASDRLVALDTMSEGLSAGAAAERFATLRDRLVNALGPPSSSSGEATSASLDVAFGRAAIQFRFADYAADLSATNLGPRGVVVREQYRSIPAPANGG